MKKKETVLCVLCLILTITLLTGCAGTSTAPLTSTPATTDSNAATPEQKEPVDLVLSTSGTGGTWFTVGTGLATIWNEKLENEGIRVYAQASGGGTENAQMLKNNEVDICFLGALNTLWAYTGENDTPKIDDMRVISSAVSSSLQYVVLKDYVKTGHITDLKGLKFSLGSPGSAGDQNFNIVSQALGGLDIKAEYLSATPSAEAMKNGNLPGACFDGGIPTGAMLDLSATPNIDIQILEFTQEDIDNMNKITPGVWFLGTVKQGMYEKMDRDYNTAQSVGSIVCTSELSDEVVYKLLDVMFSNPDRVKAIHSACERIILENALQGVPAPLHAGAVKFYRDNGVDVPDELIPPEMK